MGEENGEGDFEDRAHRSKARYALELKVERATHGGRKETMRDYGLSPED